MMTKLHLAKIIAGALVLSVLYFGVTASAQPGTSDDPLVSRSYVDTRIAALETQIAQLTALIESEGVSITGGHGTVDRELFTVVRAEPGMTLIGGASTEIILRAGEATAISGPNGLANITTGVDVMDGQAIQLNHLLIVPQNDGRGMRFHTTAYLMIKGDFSLW
ncbi:MAG: hypothetical protein FWD03_09770 [Defluviitaleaceae bacterium]|nr:hypothetical protein [Defluviitaleaceae bacterium]